MNVRNKKLGIRRGRDNWNALNGLHNKNFGFKKEDTYIYNNENARMFNFIKVDDMVKDARCFKVAAKSYELFQGDWFVTHPSGEVFYINSSEVTMGYFLRNGFEAYLVQGNNVKWKAPKVGDYKVPHLCYGWRVLTKEYLGDLRKEIEENKKESWYEFESCFATKELETVEAWIKKEGYKVV